MREAIETYAQLVGLAAMAVLWVAWTIEGVAGNNAMSVAFTSPIAVLSTLLFAVAIVAHIGWMK